MGTQVISNRLSISARRCVIPAKYSRIPHFGVLEVRVITNSIVIIASIFARRFLFWIINKIRTALFFYKKENTI